MGGSSSSSSSSLICPQSASPRALGAYEIVVRKFLINVFVLLQSHLLNINSDDDFLLPLLRLLLISFTHKTGSHSSRLVARCPFAMHIHPRDNVSLSPRRSRVVEQHQKQKKTMLMMSQSVSVAQLMRHCHQLHIRSCPSSSAHPIISQPMGMRGIY